MIENEIIEDPTKWFYLSNGKSLKSINDIINYIDEMPEYIFQAHQNNEKHDFANWFKYVFQRTDIHNLMHNEQNKNHFKIKLLYIIKEENKFLEEVKLKINNSKLKEEDKVYLIQRFAGKIKKGLFDDDIRTKLNHEIRALEPLDEDMKKTESNILDLISNKTRELLNNQETQNKHLKKEEKKKLVSKGLALFSKEKQKKERKQNNFLNKYLVSIFKRNDVEKLNKHFAKRMKELNQHAELQGEKNIEKIKNNLEKNELDNLNLKNLSERMKQVEDSKEEEFTQIINRLTLKKKLNIDEQDKALSTLNDLVQELKEKASDIRKQGKSTFFADVEMKHVPSKILMYKMSREQADLRKIKELLEKISKELKEAEDYKEVDIKKEIGEMSKKLINVKIESIKS